jgi:hypothetical protein
MNGNSKNRFLEDAGCERIILRKFKTYIPLGQATCVRRGVACLETPKLLGALHSKPQVKAAAA